MAIQSVACVSPADPMKRSRGGNDITISSRRIVLSGGASGVETEYDLEFVYGPDSTEQDLFERNINPMLRALLEGVSVTILLFGASDTLKTNIMDGLIPLTVEGLTQLLREKSKVAGASRPQVTFLSSPPSASAPQHIYLIVCFI